MVSFCRCLKYLLELYPDELNRRDGDGLPLLLMALNHDLKFVHLLLDHNADIHLLDDFLEQGSNVLHLLFQVKEAQSSASAVRIQWDFVFMAQLRALSQFCQPCHD